MCVCVCVCVMISKEFSLVDNFHCDAAINVSHKPVWDSVIPRPSRLQFSIACKCLQF